MEKLDVLGEARRLHRAGFAVHWIEPKSKKPVKDGWTSPTRDSWETLKQEFRTGYGLGVRLGKASALPEGYLANIDIDIKSEDKRHRKEAFACLEKNFPGLRSKAVSVKTSRGLRLFVVTKAPIDSYKIDRSTEKCKVFMPSDKKPLKENRQQQKYIDEELLTAKEYKSGFRIRAAWEVELMSIGKQVVLPPSIHPDTGAPYVWEEPYDPKSDKLCLLSVIPKKKSNTVGRAEEVEDWSPEPFDFRNCDHLPDDIIQGIATGDGVDNRSDYLYKAAIALVRAGASKNQVLTVLSDSKTFLGETAYEHTQSVKRSRAVQWLWKYGVKKAFDEYGIESVFGKIEAEATDLVDEDGPSSASMRAGKAKKPEDSLHPDEKPGSKSSKLKDKKKSPDPAETEPKDNRWRLQLSHNKEGHLHCSVRNIVLILENAVDPKLWQRDLFSGLDRYSITAPWKSGEIGKEGNTVSDDDGPIIAHWLARKYKIEPEKRKVFDAVTIIACKNSFHSIRKWLEQLPPWDCTERLDSALKDYFGAQEWDKYLADVFRKWMVALVKRIYEPGAKFDWMIVLQGHQGYGKSSFASILVGEDHFIDWLPKLDKEDAALNLRGVLCCEFGELDQLKKNELETTKAFVSRQVDRVRPPYGMRKIDSYRQCVFIGTTNKASYFRDETGNRRFNPVHVHKKLNFKALAAAREQLWAEALFIYKNSWEEFLDLEGEVDIYAKKLREQKMVLDESDSMLHAFDEFVKRELKKSAAERFDLTRFKLASLFDVAEGCFSKWPEHGIYVQKAANALRKFGCFSGPINGRMWWSIPQHLIDRKIQKVEKGDPPPHLL